MQKIGIIGSYPDAAEFMYALEEQRKWDYLHNNQLELVLASTAPEVLERSDVVLVCDSEEQAKAFRQLLDAKGLVHVTTRVAAQLPAKQTYPSVPMPAQKHLVPFPAPSGRYARMFTQQQPPTTKARKAARKRAKAGRKAAR